MATDLNENSDSPNLEQLMQLGIQAAKSGNKQNARMIFQQVLDGDKDNERAWLWMAAVAEDPVERLRYIKTVLRINPSNPTALRELEQRKQQKESSNSQVLVYGGIGLSIALLLVAVTVVILIAL
ncbi:MAG: hypothetical protein JXJ20_01320 [Anaerolineae bacterium]|jgi:hypothetical protein|nr:hypothetical protein [Anaerolineae bacterium]